MVAFTSLASLLVGASVVLASPLAPSPSFAKCNLANVKPNLPSGQTNVTVPSGQTLKTVALGVGVQNYTCSSAGTYTTAGAIADLYDISCIACSSQLSTITTTAFDFWNANPSKSISEADKHFIPQFAIFAQHYFGTSPSGSGISPVFDARATSQKGNPDAYILASRAGSIAAPTGSQDVDWLDLTNVQGSLAKTILRLYTKSGQPPASCTADSAPISVKYTAQYWLYS